MNRKFRHRIKFIVSFLLTVCSTDSVDILDTMEAYQQVVETTRPRAIEKSPISIGDSDNSVLDENKLEV